MSGSAPARCSKLFVFRTKNELTDTPVSADAVRQLINQSSNRCKCQFILDYRENNPKSLLLNVRELQTLWDCLTGCVSCVLELRPLVFLNVRQPGCAVFASVFPSLPLRNLPHPHVATRRIGVHRRPRETAFAPFLFLISTDCGYSYIINCN